VSGDGTRPPEPSSLRLVVTLSLAGLASGLVLAGVFLVTRPMILHNQEQALRRAVLQVLPGAATFVPLERDGDALAPAPGAEGPPRPGEIVYAARDAEGRFVGYAVPAAGPGFMDSIGLIYGFDPETRRVVGMEVLESRETPGLGDKIAYDPEFRSSFESLAVEPAIVAVKDEPSRPNEVDAITGATISSEAVVSILNGSNASWLPLISEPPAEGVAAPLEASSSRRGPVEVNGPGGAR